MSSFLMDRRTLARAGRLVFTLIIATAAISPAASPAAGADTPRVVVLGFDGADAGLTEQYMDEGILPNLSKLRDQGTYVPLGTTTPPQTPVSWSSFATGMNPGKNGIFDFLRRDLATYQPDFAMYDIGTRTVLLGKNNHYLIGFVVLVLSVLAGGLAGKIRRCPRRGFALGMMAGIVLGAVSLYPAKDLLPYRQPTVENTRQGATFWELAAKQGIRSKILRVPATFPPRGFPHGQILAGLGVPDIRGTMGTFSYYTTAPDLGMEKDTEMGGKIIEVSLINGQADSYIYGPRNRLFNDPPDILPKITMKVDRDTQPPTVTVTAGGETQTFALDEWSDWFSLEFRFSPVIKAYGIARFFFVSSEPFGLYMSAINLDPHRPVLPISDPPDFSSDLADRFGIFKTLGWAMDTWALQENRIDEDTFLQDAYFAENKYLELMKGLMDDGDYELFVHVYEVTDRVSHMFWRMLDPEHPAHDPKLAVIYQDAIRDSYRFMDQVVGEAQARLGANDVLMVCSDHGFHTWHKSANYNTWLVKNGYMTLKNNEPDTQKQLEDLFGQGQFWPNVDWSRTKAYAMGLGDIYINVKGREAKGIVEEGPEYHRIRDQLIEDLQGWIDVENGEHPVRRVLKREDAYPGGGFDEDLIPDLLATNNPKYRVSWQTSLGGIPPQLLEVNDRNWSGDHCSLDAEITKGIFFANRKLDAQNATILDLFPTILGFLNIPPPQNLDGKTLSPGS